MWHVFIGLRRRSKFEIASTGVVDLAVPIAVTDRGLQLGACPVASTSVEDRPQSRGFCSESKVVYFTSDIVSLFGHLSTPPSLWLEWHPLAN